MRKICWCLTLCLFIVSLFLSVSCNRKVAGSASQEDIVIFPPPPDTTRVQFLTSISSSSDIHGIQSGFNKFLFGEKAPENIIKPYGITVKGSRIYICDTGLGGLEIIDLAEESFEYFIPKGLGQLKLPINCFIDERGYLFVADANRKQVVVFDEELSYLDALGEQELFKPTDVSVNNGIIYVVNVLNHAIHLYDAISFEPLGVLPGISNGGGGYLYQPTNIFVSENEIYVSDFGDFCIKRYTLDGKYIESVGAYGNAYGKFTRPKGIALDSESNLYVVDAAFENVQIFNDQANLLMHFGGSYQGPGAMWLPAAVEISDENLAYFEALVDERFTLKHLIFVTNQYGPSKVSIYGFVE